MANIILRQKAIDDLTSIWKYTANEWSKKQAENYLFKLKSALQVIAKNSKKGKSYSKIDPRLLGFKVGKHIIFFQRPIHDEIDVIRILHESMDLQERLIE